MKNAIGYLGCGLIAVFVAYFINASGGVLLLELLTLGFLLSCLIYSLTKKRLRCSISVGSDVANKNERFELEMIAGESAVCLLDPALYENVRKAGGLVPLSEVFAGTPPHAVDEYGIAFGETDFARTFSSMNVFPQDSILCLRRVTSVSRLKGKKAERLQAWQTDFFTAIVEFTAPAGVE